MSDNQKSLGVDGLFKELTWDGKVITSIFELPPIKGEPFQQEFQHPLRRYLDRLYQLEDGSLLNIEHQSSLHDSQALARRLAHYHLLVSEKFPEAVLHQIVIFVPTDRSRTDRIPDKIMLDLAGKHGHGLKFSVPVKDLRKVPATAFEASGEIDDLLLGLLGPGADMPEYVEKVRSKVGEIRGEARKTTIEKLAAILLMNDNLRKQGVLDMSWIDEVKDRPFAKEFVEIAGKERIAEAERHGLAKAIVGKALEIDPNGDAGSLIEYLVRYADEHQLLSMIRDMHEMTDVASFIKEHGVEIPGLTA